MMRARLPIAALLLSFSASASTAGAQTAEDLFQQGKAAVAAKDLTRGLELYRQAWALGRVAQHACNLGNLELQLQMPRDAAEHLTYCVVKLDPSDPGAAAGRTFSEQRLQEARARVGALTIEVNLPGATVLVDEKEVGTSPLEGETFVEPGTRNVVARLAGYRDVRKEIRAAAGGAERVHLTLEPVVGAPPLPPGTTTQRDVTIPDPPPKERPVWPYYAFGGIALAGLGVGVGFLAAAGSKDSSAENIAKKLPAGACVEPRSPSFADNCADIDSLAEERRTFQGVSIAGWAVGGAGLIGFVTYLAWPRDPATPRNGVSRVRPRAQIEPSGGSVSVAYSF